MSQKHFTLTLKQLLLLAKRFSGEQQVDWMVFMKLLVAGQIEKTFAAEPFVVEKLIPALRSPEMSDFDKPKAIKMLAEISDKDYAELEAKQKKPFDPQLTELYYAFEKRLNEPFVRYPLNELEQQDELANKTPAEDDFDPTMAYGDFAEDEESSVPLQELSEEVNSPEDLVSQRLASLARIKSSLLDQVYDQPGAIEMVSDAIKKHYQHHFTTESSLRNHLVMAFVGPTGVGKTHVAKVMMPLLGMEAIRVIDMAQYDHESADGDLFGVTKEYQGAREGILYKQLKQTAKTLFLLTNFDKAHSNIQDRVGYMLRIGKVIDQSNQAEISTSEAVVVLTTTLGAQMYDNKALMGKYQQDWQRTELDLRKSLLAEKRHYRDQQINAFSAAVLQAIPQGNVVLFDYLTYNALSKLASKALDEENELFKQAYGCVISYPEAHRSLLLLALVLSFAPDFNTQLIQRQLMQKVHDVISDHMLGMGQPVSQIQLVLADELLAMLSEWSDNANEITNQFFRLNQQLSLFFELSLDANQLIISGEIVKAAPAEDFQAGSGLIVELPEHGFDRIHGHDRIKSRLNEVIKLLRNEDYHHLLSKGMLLYGPPGTGKTMLARALAKEANMPFIATTAQELIGNADLIGQIFSRARRYAPAVLFIDEFELFEDRSTNSNSYINQLVNRMLTEIDGFNSKTGPVVFLVAATNHRHKIDPALIRSGRIDLHYEVPLLDRNARRFFIEKLANTQEAAIPVQLSEADIDDLVSRTSSMSGADLAFLTREVLLHAIRHNAQQIDKALVLVVIRNMRYGEVAHPVPAPSEADLMRTAVHEAAHALVFLTLMPSMRLREVTILPRGDSAGLTVYEDIATSTWTELQQVIMIAISGRMAERHFYGEQGVNTGASSDLQKANHLLTRAVAEMGMDMAHFPNLSLSAWPQSLAMAQSAAVADRVQGLMKQLTEQTQALIVQLAPKIEQLAKRLLMDETLEHDDVQNILNSNA